MNSQLWALSIRASAVILVCICRGIPAAENPFEAPILDVRPRVFVRADEFEGLTVSKLRSWVDSGELEEFSGKWRGTPHGRAIRWMLSENADDLAAAIDGLRAMKASGGSWSDRGLALVKLASLFDWLYDELDATTRKTAAARIEEAADAAVEHIRRGRAPYFYSRTPGALAGTVVAGIALHGVSEKAEGYLQLFREWGVRDHFRALQWLDGAATGATYTLYYTYVDLAQICAAWWSATGKNPAAWIADEQDDWLGGIVRFYLWYFRPGFAFTDINDLYRGIWESHDQFCQALDIATYVTRDGHGRAWSDRWLARFGPALYHTQYAHNAIFRDPTIERRSLDDLPHAELFGKDSCAYGFFRSEWPRIGQPDTATHVFFRVGDPMNVHGGVAAGEFQIFRRAPLAARSGRYGSYDSPQDQYHRNAISTNVVLFLDPDDPRDRGDQRSRQGLKTDHRTWSQWLEIRKRFGLDVASVTHWEARPGQARCRADLTRTSSQGKIRKWVREFVWLGDEHLVVLDVVEKARSSIRSLWQLHCPAPPRIGPRRFTVVNEPARLDWSDPKLAPERRGSVLYCRVVLPERYRAVLHSGGKAEAWSEEGASAGPVSTNPYHIEHGSHVLQVEPRRESARAVFLNVLTAGDQDGPGPPAVRLDRRGPGRVELTVGSASAVLELPEW